MDRDKKAASRERERRRKLQDALRQIRAAGVWASIDEYPDGASGIFVPLQFISEGVIAKNLQKHYRCFLSRIVAGRHDRGDR